MKGLIHIYCGNGKGKTTAAVGLAVRAVGAGKRVRFVQFFKDGSSSELAVLSQLATLQVLVCEKQFGFYKNMTESVKQQARQAYSALFEQAVMDVACTEVLILDEILSACRHGMVEEKRLLQFLQEKPEELEVILTGREPGPALLETADYISEIKKIRHPFDKGNRARKGIEY